MAGAYTAKSDDDDEQQGFDENGDPVDVPDDWDPNWQFPGPAPPGYDYTYSLIISGSAFVNGETGAITPIATIYDHGTYRTIPIAGTVLQQWTVSKDGVNIPLRIGGGDFALYTETVYSQFESLFWGAEPTIEIDTNYISDGDELELRVQSFIGGSIIWDTQDIVVSSEIAKLAVTFTLIPGPQPEEGQATYWMTILCSKYPTSLTGMCWARTRHYRYYLEGVWGAYVGGFGKDDETEGVFSFTWVDWVRETENVNEMWIDYLDHDISYLENGSLDIEFLPGAADTYYIKKNGGEDYPAWDAGASGVVAVKAYDSNDNELDSIEVTFEYGEFDTAPLIEVDRVNGELIDLT